MITYSSAAARSRIVCDEPEKVYRFVADGVLCDYYSPNITAIGLERNGQLIAGVVYSVFNGSCITADIRGVGRWANREFLRVIFDYPFRQLGVKRITAVVESDNDTSQKFVKHLGFVHEATLRHAGRSGDLLVFRMFRDDCKWL